MNEHIIEAVSSTVDLGRYAAKCIAGEPEQVGTDILRDAPPKLSTAWAALKSSAGGKPRTMRWLRFGRRWCGGLLTAFCCDKICATADRIG
jgi:hypothetical protein